MWQYIICRYTPPAASFSPFPKTDSHLAVGHVAHCCGKPSLQWVQSPATWGAHTWKLSNLGDLITHYVQKAGVIPLHLTLVHLKNKTKQTLWVFLYLHIYMYTAWCLVPLEAWVGTRMAGTGVTDSYETPCWYWESTWNLLGEHPGCCSMRSKTFFWPPGDRSAHMQHTFTHRNKCFLKNISGVMVGSVWQTVWDFSGMKWSSWGTKCKQTLLAYMH